MESQTLYQQLAIAYAQARLSRKQPEREIPTKEELYSFAYDYRFALENIREQLSHYPRG